nr:MAG TPA: hypothetical protein [Caudoviricetes sp.]
MAAARPPTGGVRPDDSETEALLHRLRAGGVCAPVQAGHNPVR